jgi:hypothetical protein
VSEKRKYKRFPKRIKVAFGERELTHTGFTENISASGIFIVSSVLLKLGTQLHLELYYSQERSAYMEAEVRRLVVVEPHLRQMLKAGFGLRFITPSEIMEKALGRSASRQPFILRYASPAEFSAGFEQQLSAGGAFVISNQKPALGSTAEVHIHLLYAKVILEFSASVVHVAESGGGQFGVSLVFQDKHFAIDSLQGHLPK